MENHNRLKSMHGIIFGFNTIDGKIVDNGTANSKSKVKCLACESREAAVALRTNRTTSILQHSCTVKLRGLRLNYYERSTCKYTLA